MSDLTQSKSSLGKPKELLSYIKYYYFSDFLFLKTMSLLKM